MSDSKRPPSAEQQPQLPPQILQQADHAAAAAATSEAPASNTDLSVEPPVDNVPPPPYSAGQYGQIDISEKGMDTGARVAEDGRVDIRISSKNRRLASLLRHQLDITQEPPEPKPEPEIPEGLGYISGLPPPPMNIVIQIVGSRGDVQPFVALGLVLKKNFNHRVRIATHPVFKDFVTENGLEFFSIGGDPAELMAFMVKNPGLMPGIETLRSGDIGKRRKGIYEMIQGCWRSCIEPGDGSGPPATDEMLNDQSVNTGGAVSDPTAKPFVCDAIIANPPSFAHIHVAEKLGVPLHLMFTMPWSPTQSFPHPLANIISSNADAGMTNFLSYILVDLLTWQGVGDVINRFREHTLKLEPLSVIWAPGNLHRMRIPWTYCWSPALIPKPSDWKTTIDISGFYFLNLATGYTPPPDLEEFLNAGPPPVYIGFGSIVVDDPNAMTKLIFEAVKKTGQRALVSKGWGGLSGDEMGTPDGVFMLGNCPHDWLFKKVSCVVHHGGAGTTAAGIAAGKPTIIVPFFGDQQFWGQMCHRAGAGPEPIPHKKLTADNLAEAINFALKPETLDRAKEMCEKIKQEDGTVSGADSFHNQMKMSKMRCSICPGRVAVWQYKKSEIRLSALAATVLANDGHLDFSELRLHRPCEYVPETGPPEPISGGAAALIGTFGSLTGGIADYPSEILKAFKKQSSKPNDDGTSSAGPSGSLTPTSSRDPINANKNSSSTTSLSQTDSAVDLPNNPSQASIVVTAEDEQGTTDTPRGRSTATLGTSASTSTTSLRPEESRGSNLSPSTSQQELGSETVRTRSRSKQITMDSLTGSARATGNILAAGFKSPLDFTMSMAQGFHNAPKLYGDKTVRPTEKVTGFHSGLAAAGKEFGYGMYDGISGLVTQPLQGAKDEGLAGFGKGFIRGSLGLFFKPGAAFWAIPGYTMKGVYAEIVKNFGKSTSNFIIAARTAQGYEEWKDSSEGERERIIATWKSESQQVRAREKKVSNKKASNVGESRFYDEEGNLLKGFKSTKHLSFDDRRELHRLRKGAKENDKNKMDPKNTTSSDNATQPNRGVDMSGANSDDIEQAIRTAVQQTSNNDPEEDARIERAIRASVKEYQRKMKAESGQSDTDDDEAYNRAVAASIAEYRRSSPPSQTQRSQTDDIPITLRTEEDDEQFTRALAASLRESRRAQAQPSYRDEGLGSDTEDDEEYRRAVEASRNTQTHTDARHINDDDEEYHRAIEESKRSANPSGPPPQYEASTYHTGPSAQSRGVDEKSRTGIEPTVQPGSSQQQQPNTEEADLHRALKASEERANEDQSERERQRKEEEIVLEYVKKQSLAEEEFRRKQRGGG